MVQHWAGTAHILHPTHMHFPATDKALYFYALHQQLTLSSYYNPVLENVGLKNILLVWGLFGQFASHKSFFSLGDSVVGAAAVVVSMAVVVSGMVDPTVVVGAAGVVGASVGASEHAPMLLHSSWGLRLSLTSPSMIAGIWDSIKDLQIASGTMAESRSHTWGKDCRSRNGTLTSDVYFMNIFHLLNPLNDLVLCAVAGQPLVEVGDHVDADVAEQVLRLRLLPWQGLHQCQGGGDEEGGEEEVQHVAAASVCSLCYTALTDQPAVYIDASYLETRHNQWHSKSQNWDEATLMSDLAASCLSERCQYTRKTIDISFSSTLSHHSSVFL